MELIGSMATEHGMTLLLYILHVNPQSRLLQAGLLTVARDMIQQTQS